MKSVFTCGSGSCCPTPARPRSQGPPPTSGEQVGIDDDASVSTKLTSCFEPLARTPAVYQTAAIGQAWRGILSLLQARGPAKLKPGESDVSRRCRSGRGLRRGRTPGQEGTMTKMWVLAVILTVSLAAAGSAQAPPQAGGTETGLAAVYTRALNGRPTASGQVYDPTKLTAAHKTLPFGTTVRVTNPKNNKSVILRINDRGSRQASHLIGISAAAAARLGIDRTRHTRGDGGSSRSRNRQGHCLRRQGDPHGRPPPALERPAISLTGRFRPLTPKCSKRPRRRAALQTRVAGRRCGRRPVLRQSDTFPPGSKPAPSRSSRCLRANASRWWRRRIGPRRSRSWSAPSTRGAFQCPRPTRP